MANGVKVGYETRKMCIAFLFTGRCQFGEGKGNKHGSESRDEHLICPCPLRGAFVHMAMGQNPVPPVNIPIPTKIPTKMGGAPTPNGIPLVLPLHLS